MARVEKVLGKFKIIPKLVEQQGQAIASLQSRIPTLESSQGTDNKNVPASTTLAEVS